jgi:hypothetical protein
VRTEAEITADARPGRAFSNSTDYEIWASRYCYECVHDDIGTTAASEKNCPILTVAMISESTPREWVSGTVTTDYEAVESCTEFVQRPEWPGDDDPDGDGPPPPDPAPEVEGQLDLIDAYLDTAIGELSKAPVTS